jgi:hypothetical protein
VQEPVYGRYYVIRLYGTVTSTSPPCLQSVLTFACIHLQTTAAMPSGRWHRGHQVAATQDHDPDGDPEAGPSSHQLPQLSTLERPRECINRFPTPAFSLLCTMMDRLRTEEASKRRNTLERFFELWRIKVGNDLYPLIRLLLPDVSLVQ